MLGLRLGRGQTSAMGDMCPGVKCPTLGATSECRVVDGRSSFLLGRDECRSCACHTVRPSVPSVLSPPLSDRQCALAATAAASVTVIIITASLMNAAITTSVSVGHEGRNVRWPRTATVNNHNDDVASC